MNTVAGAAPAPEKSAQPSPSRRSLCALDGLNFLMMKGTGRFNLAQGLVALAVGLGAGLSNVVAGCIVQGFGYPVGFLSLAGVAVAALVFF